MGKRIMIVAGEASGDMYGARLVEEALQLESDVRFFGIGGADMRAAGVETLVDANTLAVMGLVEVVSQFRVIARAFSTLKRIIRTTPPDLLILIDYPGFNLRLAAVAKAAGVPVLYYISPKVWAWRPGRAKKIAATVSHVAVIFPFEVPIYEKVGAPVTFVGHPLLEMVAPAMTRAAALEAFGLTGGRVVGLFPGSRRSEITSLLPVMLAAAALLKERFPDLRFVLPLASSIERSLVDGLLAGAGVEATVVRGKNYDVMQVCDAIIAASGTVTLEIALMGIPEVIIYKVAPLTYAVGKRLVKVAHMGIGNIVAGERVVPELLQHEAEPLPIADAIGLYFTDRDYREMVVAKLKGIREKLGTPGASERVARLALGMAAGYEK
ncbi:lipid-A-disaccharide synthase [Geobacter argillaceus]|uniref:Lipid-A-disaccharide synthase n=2 Tax=Geobacter argillaceus TaxID=345631 RepID=A0A562VN11_9BACT|nr:lipid-A-disaccharide synthase [Geobacter argillaceus]